MIDQHTIDLAVQRWVQTAHSPLKVILIGSYASGKAGEDSDLDLLVVEEDIPCMADFLVAYFQRQPSILASTMRWIRAHTALK